MKFNTELATHLLHDSLFIIIAKWSAKFIIVHSWPIFLNPPATCHLPQKWISIDLLNAFNKQILSSDTLFGDGGGGTLQVQWINKRKGCHDLNFPCTTMIFNWTHSPPLNLKQTYSFANVMESWGFFVCF